MPLIIWANGLLYRLTPKGVSGLILLWLQSYLENYKQNVVVKGRASEHVAVRVSQGSVRGPLLFLSMGFNVQTP